MTDTTDKLSLQQLKDVRELCLPHTAWRSIIDELISARDQLEAERQRAGTRIAELEDRLRYTEETLIAVNDLLTVAEARVKELEEQKAKWVGWATQASDEVDKLKGDQVPVAWTSQRSLETKNKIVAFTDDMSALDYGTANGWTDLVELFTAPQKPVVLPDKKTLNPNDPSTIWCASKEWNSAIDACRAAIEAAGGIVKDGE